MGLFDWFSRKNDLPRIMQSVSERVGLGRVKWMGRNSRNYADEGFSKNVIVYRCVSILAESVASLPLQIKSGEELLDDHPVLDLLRNPNPLQSGSSFIETLVALRLISGKSFLERIIVGGVPKELWVWPDFNIHVRTVRNSFIPAEYKYESGDGATRIWPVDPITGVCDLYNWNTFNPFDPNDGMSPISAAAYSVDQHNEAGKWNMRMLQNSAEPSGVLSTENTLTNAQFEQLQAQLRSEYSGADNARRAMLLEGGLQWQQISLSPRDMDWLNGKNSSAQDIAAAFGVPLQVIPLPGSQTFANYEEARLALWEDSVLPLAGTMLDMFNKFVVPMFGDNIKLVYNENEVPALEPRRVARWDAVANASHLTINEKREATGYKKYEMSEDPADNIWIPAGLLPLSMETTTSQPDSTEEELDDGEEDVEE